MYKLIEFIRRIYVVLLFVVIQAVAIYVYSGSTFYTRAKLFSRVTAVTGGVQSGIAEVRHYFSLASQNEMLARRVAELENQLDIYRYREALAAEQTEVFAEVDTAYIEHITQYDYMTARVISSTIHRTENYITLNKGTRQGVSPDMGVVTPDGCMVGYVVDCSDNYSVVMPMLNTSFRNSGKLGGSFLGSLKWDGTSPSRITLSEVPTYAEPHIGDEVSGAGVSHYFPTDMKIHIGHVESFRKGKNQTTFDVEVRLATDFASLDYVVLVRNRRFQEVTQLEESVKNQTK